MARKDKEIRFSVLDLEGKLIGHKTDTCWTLSQKDYKPHSIKQAVPDDAPMRNLITGYIWTEENRESTEKSWFRRYPNGVIISIQDISPKNFGKELKRYRLIKKDNKYQYIQE